MRKVFLTFSALLLAGMLIGCTSESSKQGATDTAALLPKTVGINNQTSDSSKEYQVPENQNQTNNPESGDAASSSADLSFSVVLPLEDGNGERELREYMDSQKIYSLKDYKNVTLRVYSGVDLEELKAHTKPESSGIVFERLYGNPDAINDGHYELRIDASRLEGDKKVTIHKGLKCTNENRVLNEDIVLDFGAPEWHVSIQRIDGNTHEELINSALITSPTVKFCLSFDTPAVRDSVEQSIQDCMLKFYPYSEDKKVKMPEIHFDWESDKLCYVTVSDMEVDGRYQINLMQAQAQNGSCILINHSPLGYLSFRKDSTANERRENITYSFIYREPQKITALNLKDGTEREVQSLGDAYESVGPVSPNGRYVVASPCEYSWDWLCNTYNLAVFDRESGKVRYYSAVYADYLDEISIDNEGQIYVDGTKRDAATGNILRRVQGDTGWKLQIEDKYGKVIGEPAEKWIDEYNFYWLKNGLVVYRGSKEDSNGSFSAIFVVDAKGTPVKTFTGYQLLSASPDGSMLAVQKDNVIELYDSNWGKLGALDMKTLGASLEGEDLPYDFRELVTLFWGKEKICVTFHQQDNGRLKACLWEYSSGKMAVADLSCIEKESPDTANVAPLYFDSSTDELLYVKDAWQMWSSFTYVD